MAERRFILNCAICHEEITPDDETHVPCATDCGRPLNNMRCIVARDLNCASSSLQVMSFAKIICRNTETRRHQEGTTARPVASDIRVSFVFTLPTGRLKSARRRRQVRKPVRVPRLSCATLSSPLRCICSSRHSQRRMSLMSRCRRLKGELYGSQMRASFIIDARPTV